MTTDIKSLVETLRKYCWQRIDEDGDQNDSETPYEAADALEAMAGENERLNALIGPALEAAESERDRLKAALRLWQDAWATGRNEPMAIAANVTKNELGGDA